MDESKKQFIEAWFELLDKAPTEYLQDIDLRLKGFKPKYFVEIQKEFKVKRYTISNQSFIHIEFGDNMNVIQHFD